MTIMTDTNKKESPMTPLQELVKENQFDIRTSLSFDEARLFIKKLSGFEYDNIIEEIEQSLDVADVANDAIFNPASLINEIQTSFTVYINEKIQEAHEEVEDIEWLENREARKDSTIDTQRDFDTRDQE